LKIKRLALLRVLVLILIAMPLAACAGSSADGKMQTFTLSIQKSVQAELDSLDRDIKSAATQLSATGLSGTGARQILNDLFNKYVFLFDCNTIDTSGKMITVAPDSCISYEGANVASIDWIKDPAMSNVFRAVEGIDAVFISRPIYSEQGDVIGALSVLFQPEPFISAVAGQQLKNTEYEFHVMQTDGLTIFNSSGEETGKNLLTDPSYKSFPDLVELGRRFSTEESGTGNYTFVDHATGKDVEKYDYWVSAGLHGTSFRLISVRE
jgi:hypothetical protein